MEKRGIFKAKKEIRFSKKLKKIKNLKKKVKQNKKIIYIATCHTSPAPSPLHAGGCTGTWGTQCHAPHPYLIAVLSRSLATQMPWPLTSGSVQRACCCRLTLPHLNPCILMVAAETPTHSAPFPCTWVRVRSSDLVSP